MRTFLKKTLVLFMIAALLVPFTHSVFAAFAEPVFTEEESILEKEMKEAKALAGINTDGEKDFSMIDNGDHRHSFCASPVTYDDIPVRSGGAKRTAADGTPQKTIPLLIIVIGFPNVGYSADYDWNDTFFHGNQSLARFYSDQSLGKFTFTPVQETSEYGVLDNYNTADRVNDGVVHVSSAANHQHWDTEQNIDSMAGVFSGAILMADYYVNFAQYDANGNGAIENNEMALGFVVAGFEEATDATAGFEPTLLMWAHSWSIQNAILYAGLSSSLSVPAPDGVQVSSYIAIAENYTMNLSTLELTQEPISVVAHELGHYLGLPDLYDTQYLNSAEWKGYNPGYLSVMCSGEWAERNDGTLGPSSFDPWCKFVLEWVKPEIITGPGTHTVNTLDVDDYSTYNNLAIQTEHEYEWYFVENRQFKNWDEGLDKELAVDGIILWHVDMLVYYGNLDSNRVNYPTHRPAVTPLYLEHYDTVDSGGNTVINITMIGNAINRTMAAFDNSIWNTYYLSLGDALHLPIYGATNADQRSSRTLSGIAINFPDDSGDSMRVKIKYPYTAPEINLTNMGVGQAHAQKSGIRVFFSVKSGCYFDEKVTEIGAVIRNDAKSTESMKVDADGNLLAASGQAKITLFRDQQQIGSVYSEENGATVFTVLLMNIKNPDREYSFRAYAIYKDEYGDNKVVYSPSYKAVTFNKLSV